MSYQEDPWLKFRREQPAVAARLIELDGGDVCEAEATFHALRVDGAEKERKRCVAHVEAGRRAGALDIAFAAILSGASVEETSDQYFDAAVSQPVGGWRGVAARHSFPGERVS